MSRTQPIKNESELEDFKNYYRAKSNPRNYVLIVLGLNTALRIGDILNLKWEDVYNQKTGNYKHHIDIREQKTGKQTLIAMNSAVRKALHELVKYQCRTEKNLDMNAYIFTGRGGKNMPLSRYQAYRIIKEAANDAVPEGHISCHSLRKTFGYFAWKQGVQPAMLMNIYNHSSYQITKRYLGIEQEDKDEVYMKIKI